MNKQDATSKRVEVRDNLAEVHDILYYLSTQSKENGLCHILDYCHQSLALAISDLDYITENEVEE